MDPTRPISFTLLVSRSVSPSVTIKDIKEEDGDQRRQGKIDGLLGRAVATDSRAQRVVPSTRGLSVPPVVGRSHGISTRVGAEVPLAVPESGAPAAAPSQRPVPGLALVSPVGAKSSGRKVSDATGDPAGKVGPI